MHLMRLLSRLLTTSFALWCICFPFVASKATNSKLKTAVTKTKALSSSKVQSSSPTSTSEKFIFSKKNSKGDYVLTYFGLMVAGAIARSVSATAIHPLNVIKIMLQKQGGKMPALNFQTMTRGAGSQFIMSIPHGAINFVITEVVNNFIFSSNLNMIV